MISRQQLIDQIKQKKTFLCVGLDTDVDKIPEFLKEYPDPAFEFNKRIIDATKDLCIAYKPNAAFYESRGMKGLQSLISTYEYLPKDCLSIIDAKRGDIGNTSDNYAKAFFNEDVTGMGFDAITVTPYMGNDSVTPYLKYDGKWVIILALTSSVGSKDFQYLHTGEGYLYETVIKKANTWAGVGAQGGSLEDVCKYGMTADCGLIVNASRSIIYASNGEDFAEAARAEALSLQKQMQVELEKAGII
jgi:orotidine-5'-phosphate decarboxylase